MNVSSVTQFLSDCAERNLMVDIDSLYPEGYHPVYLTRDPAAQRLCRTLPRGYAPVKYYFIDFGMSVYWPPNWEGNRLVLGTAGRDQDVPELSLTVPYDPFKVDIRIIGNMLRQSLHEVNSALPAASVLISSRSSRNTPMWVF